DSESFRPLVQRYQRVVFSVAFRMLGARADAEDVAQQAFVDAFGALDRFRSDGRKNAFGTWIIRIAINRCKDVLKSKKRTEESLDADVLGGVPLKYREILVLKDVEELSYEEIRAILDLPITTLKIRVVRARAMMRAH